MVATKVSRFMKIARFVSLQLCHTVILISESRNERSRECLDLWSNAARISQRFSPRLPRGFPGPAAPQYRVDGMRNRPQNSAIERLKVPPLPALRRSQMGSNSPHDSD